MSLDSLRKEYMFIKEKGYSIGLSYKNYCELLGIYNSLKELGLNNHEVKSLYTEISKILEDMKASGITKKFNSENRDYIRKNALLLPLVYHDYKMERKLDSYHYLNVDSEVHLTGLNSFTFDCVFCNNDDNKFLVKDLYNRFVCNNCGMSGRLIDYVMEHNNLKFNQALELLCRIYRYELPYENRIYKNDSLDDLAGIYRDVFYDDDLIELMDMAENRLKDQNISKFGDLNVSEEYEKRRQTILRVRNGESDPNFIYQKPKKFMLLKR